MNRTSDGPQQNKANSSMADGRLPRFARNDMLRIGAKPVAGPASLRHGQWYKQTQFAGTNCAKQTQFRQRERRGKCLAGKELW